MASVISKTQPASAIPIYSVKSVFLIGLCFVLSGATGLIYEVLWARMLGLVFGATTLAVSTVLAAFMGGLALGSALAGRIAPRIKRPFRAYGLLEICIALYALAVPFLFSLVDNLYAVIWQQLHPGFFVFSLWRFLLSCLMLLVPTTIMGATLPVLSAALLRSPDFKNTSVTRLYTCNLIGAILGTVGAGFFLLPALGVRATIYTAAVINIVIGLVAIYADRAATVSATEVLRQPPNKSAVEDQLFTEVQSANGYRFWLFCAFVSGFVTISTQVSWTRTLTMVIGSSTYAFSIVVALFLIGLSAGAYLIGKKDHSGKLRKTIFKVEITTAVSLFLSIAIVNAIPGVLIKLGLGLNVNSWAGLLGLQIFSAALLILLPAFLMGTVMPLVLVWASEHRGTRSVQLVGRTYAVNTIGAIAGAFCAGFFLIPKLTTRITVLFAAALCLIAAGFAYEPPQSAGDPDVRRSLAVGLSAALAVAMFVMAPRLNAANFSVGAYDSLVRVLARAREGVNGPETTYPGPEIHELLMYEEGATSTVSVRKDWHITSMAINGRTNASDTDDMPTQVMLAQLPLLVAPGIKNALIVGFASGVSVGSMLQSPIESVECLELERATVNGSRFFEHVNNHPLEDPRLHLIIDDARTYLRVTPERYDIIVSEPNHPWVPGVANLFTQEFFQMGRNRLSDGGVFAQWLQIYQLSNSSLRSVLATYQSVFPNVLVFRVGGAAKGKDLVLLGSMKPLSLDLLKQRLSDPKMNKELGRVQMATEEAVRDWYVCDQSKLGAAVTGSVINTDDNMHIETTVPREAFLPLMQGNAQWIESLR